MTQLKKRLLLTALFLCLLLVVMRSFFTQSSLTAYQSLKKAFPRKVEAILARPFEALYDTSEPLGRVPRSLYLPTHSRPEFKKFAGFKPLHQLSPAEWDLGFTKDSKLGSPIEPFTAFHLNEQGKPLNTGKVFVLGHGLSDSPYVFRDIAEVIYRKGFNVIAFPLSGHSRDSYLHLEHVSDEDWFSDWHWALQTALDMKLGDQIVVGGFSTSAAVISRLLTSENEMKTKIAAGLFFAPAFDLRKPTLTKTPIGSVKAPKALSKDVVCLGSLHKPWAHRHDNVAPDGHEFRYIHMTARSECALLDTIQKAQLATNIHKIDIPFLTVLSDEDGIIDAELTTRLMLSKPDIKPVSRYLYYHNSKSFQFKDLPGYQSRFSKGTHRVRLEKAPLGHFPIMLDQSKETPGLPVTKEKNSRFDIIKEELESFISQL